MKARQAALGGVTTALALVVQCLGGLIPFATFICPIVCIVLLAILRHSLDRKNCWTWYGAVAILSLLLGPDKEGAMLFCCLGFYPLIKPGLDRMTCKSLWKTLLFNGSITLMYVILIRFMGLDSIVLGKSMLGPVFLIICLLLGNLCFWLLDMILNRIK